MYSKEIMITNVKLHIAAFYKISVNQLEEGHNWFPDVEARHICIWILNEYIFNNLSPSARYSSIKKYFKSAPSRTNIYSLIKKINQERLLYDQNFKQNFTIIESFVKHQIESYEKFNN